MKKGIVPKIQLRNEIKNLKETNCKLERDLISALKREKELQNKIDTLTRIA